VSPGTVEAGGEEVTSATAHLDRLVAELASIQDRLLQDPSFEERAALHERQEELHAEAGRLGRELHNDGTVAQAKAQLAHLETYRFELAAAHVPHALTPATELGTGMAQRDLDDLYSRSIDAFERDHVENEIRRLRQRIATLEAA
jgi:hypothetical protein